MYRQLKVKTLQTIRGAASISPKLEFDYILRIASLYDRLGCDILALDLVKNWKFTVDEPLRNPPLLSRRRSTIDDLSPFRARNVQKLTGVEHMPSIVAEETNLLDSFEFGF
jgi:rabconnectin-3a